MAASLIIRPVAHIAHSLTGGLSRAGRCHTLDERADGFARSEAIIAAVLRSGSSSCMIDPPTVCSDGRSASFTAPNGQAQRVMIAAALSSTGLMADEVSYYEAHGTGTKLGDPTEVSSSAAALLRPRKEMIRALAFGGVKSHVGHVEPGAGLVGLLVLACALKAERVPPNAQLRVMNEHVDEVLRGLACEAGVHESELLPEEAAVGGVSSFGINGTIAHALVRSRRDAAVRGASVLSSSQLRALNPLVRERLGRASSPFVLPAQEVVVCAPVGGVSSFGYSGTIAHAVLQRGAGEAWMLPPAVPVIYRRHAFPWREASAVSSHTCMRAMCWAANDTAPLTNGAWASCPCFLVVAARPATHTKEAAAAPYSCRVVVMLRSGNSSSAPSLRGLELTLVLVQQLLSFAKPPLMRVVTCGVLASDAAHGGVWGFARVLRLERPALGTQSIDVPYGAATLPPFALQAPSAEGEVAWRGGMRTAARLRECSSLPILSGALARGAYADRLRAPPSVQTQQRIGV